MRFLKGVTVPKNVKGGPFGIFGHPLCCKISKQTKGRPFGAIQKISKKHSAEKNPQVKNTKGGGDDPMFSRFWTSMFLFWTRFWRFEYVLDVRSSS